MQENSGGIDAPSSANIEDLKKNLGGGGGKNNSVFAASLRELSQPNYYRYCAPTWIQYGARDILIEPMKLVLVDLRQFMENTLFVPTTHSANPDSEKVLQ